MPEEQTSTQIECPSCQRRNDADMSFCLYCGASMKGDDQRASVSGAPAVQVEGRTCPNCQKTDKLNVKFCVFCGSDMVVPGSEEPDSTAFRKFSWELQRLGSIEEIEEKAAQAAAPALKQRSAPRTMMVTLVLALVGLALGALSAVALGRDGITMLFQRMHWPREGLVIYSTPPNATVLIEDSNRQNFISAKTGADGSLSLPDLAGGDYTVFLSAPGHLTIRQPVPVKDHCTTVLGFPKRLALPAAPSESGAGN